MLPTLRGGFATTWSGVPQKKGEDKTSRNPSKYQNRLNMITD